MDVFDEGPGSRSRVKLTLKDAFALAELWPAGRRSSSSPGSDIAGGPVFCVLDLFVKAPECYSQRQQKGLEETSVAHSFLQKLGLGKTLINPGLQPNSMRNPRFKFFGSHFDLQ